MTIFVGEAVTIVASAIDPLTGQVISSAEAEVELYAPPKNPVTTPADRVLDNGPFPLNFNAQVLNKDGTKGAYVGYVSTVGYEPGTWYYKVTLSGTYDSWEYSSFKLKA